MATGDGNHLDELLAELVRQRLQLLFGERTKILRSVDAIEKFPHGSSPGCEVSTSLDTSICKSTPAPVGACRRLHSVLVADVGAEKGRREDVAISSKSAHASVINFSMS